MSRLEWKLFQKAPRPAHQAHQAPGAEPAPEHCPPHRRGVTQESLCCPPHLGPSTPAPAPVPAVPIQELALRTLVSQHKQVSTGTCVMCQEASPSCTLVPVSPCLPPLQPPPGEGAEASLRGSPCGRTPLTFSRDPQTALHLSEGHSETPHLLMGGGAGPEPHAAGGTGFPGSDPPTGPQGPCPVASDAFPSPHSPPHRRATHLPSAG